jgi:hypothetical protein
MKNRRGYTAIVIMLLLTFGIIAFLYFSGILSFLGLGELTIGNLPPETQSITWKGVQVDASSVKFGSTSSSYSDGFCGSDGSLLISNSISSGSQLSFHSGISGEGNCRGNYVKGAMLVPAGHLTGSVSLSGGVGSYGAEAISQISFNGKSFKLSVMENSNDCPVGGCSRSKIDSIDFTFDEPTEITFSLISSVGGGQTSSASADLVLDFVPFEEVSDEPSEVGNEGTSNNSLVSVSWFQKIINWFKSLFGWW